MLGPVGHDIFIPSIPKIADGLNTTTNQVSVSISAIFLGNAIGTLFHGPLADRFGHRFVAGPGTFICAIGMLWWVLMLNEEPNYLIGYLPGMVQAICC